MKKQILIFVVFAIIIIIANMAVRGNNGIECALDNTQGKLFLHSNNVIIQRVTLKYDTGIVQFDETDYSLSICNKGTEYIRVDYMDKQSVCKYVTFELIISDVDLLQISVSKYNMMGEQEEHHAY